MTSENSSVLSKKIARANFDISVFPLLEDLASSELRAFSLAVTDLTQQPTQLALADIVMKEREAATENMPDEAPYYWMSTSVEEDGVLLQLSPGFLVSLSAHLLGSDFTLSENATSPTTLDIELSRLLIEKLSPRLSANLIELSPDYPSNSLKLAATSDNISDVIKGKPFTALFSVSLDYVEEAGGRFPCATLHYPLEFLERRGLLEAPRQELSNLSDMTGWHASMQTNVFSSQIDLAVVLDRYMTTLSEFSNAEIGDVIPLENQDRHVDVVLKTRCGPAVIGKGLLGTYKKSKAVKVVDGFGLETSKGKNAA